MVYAGVGERTVNGIQSSVFSGELEVKSNKNSVAARAVSIEALRRRMSAWIVIGVLLSTASAFGLADLGVSQSDSPDPVRVGNSLTYHLSVTNRGPDTATNVVMTDVLPDSVTFVSCTPSAGSYSNDGNTVYCDLGDLLNGGTAAVIIVSTPTVEFVIITNQASISADNGSGNRSYEETEVIQANRAPVSTLNGPYTLPLGATTSIVVTVTDSDHDPLVTVSNTVHPTGSTFNGTNFVWTAAGGYFNTTNTITFVANDHQGEANSVVTNSTVIVVPYDSDSDTLDDEWEWDNFTTLTNTAIGDVDDDESDNGMEYIANTQPTNSESVFQMDSVDTPVSGNEINVRTEPERKYTIYWQDVELTGTQSWVTFVDLSDGVGTWTETNVVSTNYVFIDDEGASTTASSPANGKRFYKIKVQVP